MTPRFRANNLVLPFHCCAVGSWGGQRPGLAGYVTGTGPQAAGARRGGGSCWLSSEFFLIVDGTARAEVSAEEHVLLHPGEFFGEMSLLDGGPRSATVVADTPGRPLVISRRHFAVLLKDVPGLTETLLVTLSRRVRQAEERAERLGSP